MAILGLCLIILSLIMVSVSWSSPFLNPINMGVLGILGINLVTLGFGYFGKVK